MRATLKHVQAELSRLEKESAVLHCALNDVINGEVKWFRRGKLRLGICRACGPSGGIVLHSFRTVKGDGSHDVYTCAYYWEDWYPRIRDDVPSFTNVEALDLRNLAIEAHTWILNEQRPKPNEVLT